MIHFKRATNSDSELINHLVNSAYRGDSSRLGWTTEADLLDGQRTDLQKIHNMINEPLSRIELALNQDEEILGCVHLRAESDALYLGMLTVSPKLQSRGIGKLLLNRSEEIAREFGLLKIRMTVIRGRTELIAYYKRRGYRNTGRIEPFPENDPSFGLPKTKGLVFEEFIKQL